jgi:TonB family protein
MKPSLALLLLASCLPAWACPPEHMPAPGHPSEVLWENLQGRVVIAVQLDACGQVTGAEVSESAGHEALDAAALAAVRAWVFPASLRERARDGRLRVPVEFDALRDVETQAFHWPDSHRRARFEVDDRPLEYTTLAAVSEAVQTPEALMASPFTRKRGAILDPASPERGNFYRMSAGGEPVYWQSFLRWSDFGETQPGQLRPRTVAVARYRLVFEHDLPVVRVAVLCEDEAPQCDHIRRQALKRPPIR